MNLKNANTMLRVITNNYNTIIYHKKWHNTSFKWYALCVLFLMLVLQSKAYSQEDNSCSVFSCSYENMGAIPDQYLMVFEDTTNNLTFKNVYNFYPQNFLPFSVCKKHLKRHTNYWVRFALKNERGMHTAWMLQLGLSRFSDVYIPNQNGVYSVENYGYNWPDAKKPHSEILWDVAHIPMDAHELKVIFIRFHSDLKIGAKPLIKVETYQELKEQTLIINILQGVFHGMVLMMLLYSLFMFVSLRDTAFLYYVFYVGAISASMFILVGYMRHYVVYNTGCNPLNSELIIQYMGTIYLLFFRKFADLKKMSLKAEKYVRILIYISIVLALATTVLWFNNYYAFNLFAQLSSLFELVALISVIVISFMNGNKIIRYFLIGSLCFTFGAIIILVGILVFRLPFAHLLPIFQIGVVCELFLFSIGLSQRYKHNEQQRKLAQDQLIAELQMREAYQQRVNEELEQKVRERTAEISQQKEEIMVQRDHIESQKDIIEQANKQLVDSIQYARFIQKTIFQEQKDLQQYFADSFIWLKPHSMVSGDFYWWHKVSDNQFIFAVADCTGHGVPGAMMTVIANGMLEEIVTYKKQYLPNQILETLEKMVSSRFVPHETSQAQSSNGLDIGIALIDKGNQKLYFSGAKIPLYYVKNKESFKIKAELYGIGGHSLSKHKTFELHELSLDSQTVLYMFTDGVQDQFGGQLNKKFTSQRLIDLIVTNSELPMEQQKNIIENTIERWKIGYSQTDDILISGFRV